MTRRDFVIGLGGLAASSWPMEYGWAEGSADRYAAARRHMLARWLRVKGGRPRPLV